MGISQLMKVLGDHAPNALKEVAIDHLLSRVIAVDASMALYQFLIAVRQGGQQLTNEAGETTSHLMGMFYRTIRMIENGIKPVYVFDGKAPTLKSNELAKRSEKREEAAKSLEAAEEEGDAEKVDKFSRRLVRVTREHNDEAKRLLRCLGVPYVEAPCEAEAQCAELAKAGKIYGTASEDMDSLTFGSPFLLRYLTYSEARGVKITEITLSKVLQSMELNMDEFIDLCILLGCDYCTSIKGIGPHRAVQLIKQHRSLEAVIKNLDTTKHPIPEDWPYKEARELFKKPDVISGDTYPTGFKWNKPDEEAVVDFLVKEKGFNEERVKNGLAKLNKARAQGSQGRLDNFFSFAPKKDENAPPAGQKRKSDEKEDASKKKKGETAAKSAAAKGAASKKKK